MPAPSTPGGGSSPLPPTPSPGAGLCQACEYQQLVRNTRGSTFSLCRRSREDPGYPRYPRLPVIECDGYEPRTPVGAPAS